MFSLREGDRYLNRYLLLLLLSSERQYLTKQLQRAGDYRMTVGSVATERLQVVRLSISFILPNDGFSKIVELKRYKIVLFILLSFSSSLLYIFFVSVVSKLTLIIFIHSFILLWCSYSLFSHNTYKLLSISFNICKKKITTLIKQYGN